MPNTIEILQQIVREKLEQSEDADELNNLLTIAFRDRREAEQAVIAMKEDAING